MIQIRAYALAMITILASTQILPAQNSFEQMNKVMMRKTLRKGAAQPTIDSSLVAFSNDWDLEIRNRSLSGIYVAIAQSGQSLTDENNGSILILGAKRSWWRFINESSVQSIRIRGIDLTSPLQITIYAAESGFQEGFVRGKQLDDYEILASGKKIFLTWENGKLRPQKGIRGKTQSGIQLPAEELRIKESDIIKARQ